MASIFALSGCHGRSLLSGLTEPQVNGVVAVLQRNGVSAEKIPSGKGVFEVKVSQGDFPAAVDLVRRYNLPEPPDLQISQAFPADSLVSTPLAEHSRLISYIEQRLSGNLSALDHVVRVRVNVSYPLADDLDKPRRMHVAVLVIYSGEHDKDTLISQVKRYVKNSFDQIDYDDISVIAEQSEPVFRATPSSAPLTSATADWMHLGMRVSAIVGVLALLAAAWFGLNSQWLAMRRWRERRGASGSRRRFAEPSDQRSSGAHPSDAAPSRASSFLERFRKPRERVEPFIK